MPTTTFPPILVWQPGGGTPVGPVSNPPVYSQNDVTQLVIGQAYVDVVFGSVQTDNNWVLVTCEVENTIDLDPLNIWPGLITSRTPAGFRLQLNGMPDSGNYYLHWAVSGVNIPPVAATLYLFTGPTSGAFSAAATFTVRLPPSTTLAGSITVTPSDGGVGGTFLPSSVVLSSGSASATFTYIPTHYGAITLSVTNSGTLSDPANIAFTCVASFYDLTGPSGGEPSVASANFTVALASGGVVIGTVTVTPSDGSGGGTFTPTTVNLTTVAPSATFVYNAPAATGAKTISTTNNHGLTDPSPLTYTVAVTPHLLNTLISFWKLDEASGNRNDSVGTNHLSPVNAPVGVAGMINNGAQFVAASGQYLSVASNPSLQVSTSFTFSAWVKLNSLPASENIVLSKDLSAIGPREFSLEYYTGAPGFLFFVAADYGNSAIGSPVAPGVWTHIVAWYDLSTQKVSLRYNDTTTYVGGGVSSALVAGASNFRIGARDYGTSPPGYWDGIVDEVGFWKRILTAAEITALYNGGAGLPFSSFTS